MTLTDRVNQTDWSEQDMALFKRQVECAAIDPLSRDLLLAITAAVIGYDGADLMTIRRRGRELVDLAVLMQAERAQVDAVTPARPPGQPVLTIVGGSDA